MSAQAFMAALLPIIDKFATSTTRGKFSKHKHDKLRASGPAIRRLINHHTTLQCLYQLSNSFTTYDSFQPKPVVL